MTDTTTLPLTIAEQVEQHFPALRAKSKHIRALESRVAAKKNQRKLMYAKAHDEASRIDAEVAATNRQIRLEEALIRRKIARDIEAGREVATVIRRANRPKEEPSPQHTEEV